MPQIHESAFVAERVEMYGEISIGPQVSVWPKCVIRAEANHVTVGRLSNLQDFVMVHIGYEAVTEIGEFCSITHHATVHGAVIEDHCLIGINAVVMDGAEIGECSFVAALSFVRARFLVPPRTVVAGIPAKILRELTQEEIDWKRESDFDYIEIARRSHASLELVEALTEPDAEGVRMNVDGISPLFKVRKN